MNCFVRWTQLVSLEHHCIFREELVLQLWDECGCICVGLNILSPDQGYPLLMQSWSGKCGAASLHRGQGISQKSRLQLESHWWIEIVSTDWQKRAPGSPERPHFPQGKRTGEWRNHLMPRCCHVTGMILHFTAIWKQNWPTSSDECIPLNWSLWWKRASRGDPRTHC